MLEAQYQRLYKPDVFNDMTISAEGSWVFKNFWEASLVAGYLPDQHDYFVLGQSFDKYARRPAYGYANLTGNTDGRKRFLFTYNFLLADFFKVQDKKYHIAEAALRYRFSNKFSLEISNRHEAETDYIVNSNISELNGDPIIGFVDFKEVTTILSSIYNFTPRINLTLRARHYWSNVIYKRFANVDNKGNPISRSFIAGLDENINFFNADAFFTWDFRLGSRLILGWKNWLGKDYEYYISGNSYKAYTQNARQLFSAPHGNEFTIRFIYFLNYQQLNLKASSKKRVARGNSKI
jgi:hypothetical protein